ncbi:MAG: AAA family ATPase [Kouleothrix sp.]|nr:AAA family ATPase [Kouleothrix sp.]
MARTTAQVEGATLVLPERDTSPIPLDTPAWFAWLEHATTFAFRGPSGHFTARKERQARGGGYWKAYRTSHGTLHRVYLGKAQDLTLDRLNQTAVTLAAAAAPAAPHPVVHAAVHPASTPAVRANVLATKLFVPPARTNLVVRPRLFERLEAGSQHKLTLIAAPAGFGKTTLVSAWLAMYQRPTAWLSLDKGDSDPIRFLTYLFAALQTIAPTLGAGVVGVLQSSQPPPIEAILTALLNDITTLPDKLLLVFDDYHLIDAKPVDAALAFLLDHLPPQLHLVIATREDPQLPLARLRARGQLTELRAADLRFTPTEAAAFLREAMGLNLSAEDVAALETRTEGWIAGLQLAALSMQGQHDATSFIQSFTGSHHFVLDYLLEEVLTQQSARVQMFLLRTSILDRLCGPLCDAVLRDDTGSGQTTLEYLDHANLFLVPLDNERRWYRYHHLFVDLLRQRLHQSAAAPTRDDGDGAAELHRRASQWYEDQGLEIEAFQHAAAAGDVARAERLIEGAGVPLHFRGARTLVLNWLESLPTTVLDARPALWVAYVTLLTFEGDQTVELKLQAAEAALSGAEPGDTTQNLLGHIAALRAMLAVPQHDVETVIAQARRALEYLHPTNLPLRTIATWALGYAYHLQGDRPAASRAYSDAIAISEASESSLTTIMATGGLGQIQEADNQLHLAAESYRRVLDLVGEPAQPIACEAYLGLARIAYQWNDLQAAEQHGHQCWLLTRELESVDTFASYGIFLARLRLAQGDLSGAIAALESAETFVHRHHFVFRMPDIAEAQVLVLLRQGDLEAAAQLAQTHDLPISQARVQLAQGDPSTALAMLYLVRRQVEAKRWQDERLKVMVVEALAHHAHGETDAAMHVLRDVLALAKPHGFLRLFVDEGPAMARLLSEAAALGIKPDYIDRLLAAFPSSELKVLSYEFGSKPPNTQHSTLNTQHSLTEPLSHRELEVLHLISQGLSNREISERLFLALDTVKGHNQKIFSKLQVQRRTEAVSRARELGLL